MLKSISRQTLVLLLCFLLVSTTTPAHATNTLQRADDALVGGIVAISAAIVVVAVILVVHHQSATVKGCVAFGPNGLQLTNSSDGLVYELSGTTSDIKSGDLVKVKGKKKSGKGTTPGTFNVKEVSKDYGTCPATP